MIAPFGPPEGRPRYGRWYPEREYDTDPPPEKRDPIWGAMVVVYVVMVIVETIADIVR